MSTLPAPNEPLVLADGTKIDPVDGSVVRGRSRVEVPKHSEAQELVTRTRLKLRDLPVNPDDGLNTLSVIVMYVMIGLSNDEIGVALGIPETRVANLRMMDAFGELQELFMKQIVEKDADGVRAKIAQHANHAADTMISLLDSESESIAMTAAKDILDRDGHRPVDVVQHRHTMEDGLVIAYISKNEGDDDVPKLIEGEIVAE